MLSHFGCRVCCEVSSAKNCSYRDIMALTLTSITSTILCMVVVEGVEQKEVWVVAGSELELQCEVLEQGEPLWEVGSHQLLEEEEGIITYSAGDKVIINMTNNALNRFAPLDNGMASVNISLLMRMRRIGAEETKCSFLIHRIGRAPPPTNLTLSESRLSWTGAEHMEDFVTYTVLITNLTNNHTSQMNATENSVALPDLLDFYSISVFSVTVAGESDPVTISHPQNITDILSAEVVCGSGYCYLNCVFYFGSSATGCRFSTGSHLHRTQEGKCVYDVEPEVWTVVAVYRDSTQGPHLPVTFREDSTPPCQVSTAIPTADSSGETSVISNAGLLLAVAMQL